MNSSPLHEQVQLFKSVFKRTSGCLCHSVGKREQKWIYTCTLIRSLFYRAHKAKGGTFQNYKDKTYLALTDDQIEKHLKGDQLVGIYPLLTDNTSGLIAADFDGEKWDEECWAFINACREKGITAYFERSRY